MAAFEICLSFLRVCKQQQVVILDSHCEAADILFHLKAFGSIFFSDPVLAELGFKALLDKQGDRQPALLLRSSVCSGAHPECQPCPLCSFPCSLAKAVICADPGGSKDRFSQ